MFQISPRPLLRGTLLQRYKRFLADIKLEDRTTITAICPNTGSMKTCCEPGRPVLLSDSGPLEETGRKYRYTWEMIQMGRTWVGVNTANPNRAVPFYIHAGSIPELAGYASVRREVKYGREGRSRIDLLLESAMRPACYVEIKNTTMRDGKHAAFPDAVTGRGQKHLEELADVVRHGMRAVMFYFVGRADCTRFRPADEIDPQYGELLRAGVTMGVEIVAYQMKFSAKGIELGPRLPVDL